MGKYVPHPVAEELAYAVLSAGGSRADAVEALEMRFPGQRGWQRSGAIAVGIAQLIEEFELGEVEKHLAFPTDEELRCMTAKERKGRETKQEQAWQHYDSLTDPDASANDVIAAAKKLDKLLALGWARRLPRGCFQCGKGGG